MPDVDKQTPLHDRHQTLGATMAPFAGWTMPLWYQAGAVREHLAVVTAAGVFDTSHMDVLVVSGPDAASFLDYAFTREIGSLRPNRCGYGAFLDSDGACLDDGIVYPLDGGRYGVVVNASMAGPLTKHLCSLPGGENVVIAAPEIPLAKIDIQGPLALDAMACLGMDKDIFSTFPYFSFKGDFDLSRSSVRLADGTRALISRSGYTGEFGFELFLPADRAGVVWDSVLEDGRRIGVVPAGLAARDTLRAGAVLPLSHQDIGPWPFKNHPWMYALPLHPDGSFRKHFRGRSGLERAVDALHTLPFVGYDQRRVEADAATVHRDNAQVGTATTVVTDVAIGRLDGRVQSIASPTRPDGWTPKGLVCGFVRVQEPYPVGTELMLRDRRREIRVEVVEDIRPARSARQPLHFRRPA